MAAITEDTSLSSAITERLIERLTASMRTMLDKSDRVRAFVVRDGRLQDSPTQQSGVSIMVYPNDPESPGSWQHSIMSMGQRLGIRGEDDPFELGGGARWYRRFTVVITMFWGGAITRSESRELSNVAMSRSEHALQEALYPDSVGPDTFGEEAIAIYPVRSEITVKGGDGSHIDIVKIYVMVLTGKE